MLRTRQNIAIFLLVCFLPVVTPKEFIHYMFRHVDTICHFHSDRTVGIVHKHCSILQITASAFVPEQKPPLAGKIVHPAICFLPDQPFISEISCNLSFLRAPPDPVF